MRLDRRTAAAIPSRLFHYTGSFHLPSIMAERSIRTTESNIDFTGAGPRVVWLTDVDSDRHGWAGGGGKGEVRFTIETSGLPIFWWPDWSRAQGIEEFWYSALARSGGGNPESWYVCTQPISDQHWADVEAVAWQGGRFESVLPERA